MIGSKDLWNSICRTVAFVLLGASVSVSGSMWVTQEAAAQQAQPKSSAAPKKSAPRSDWVKFCTKNEQTGNRQICSVQHEALDPNTGMTIAGASLRMAEGDEKKFISFIVPTVKSLVMPMGVSVQIDEQQPIQLPYSVCIAVNCQAQMELTDEMYQAMRGGKEVILVATNVLQEKLRFVLPLNGFSATFDGAPTDLKAFEEHRRKLVQDIQKRRAELAAKAKAGEGQAGQAAQPPVPVAQPPAAPQ